MDPDFRYMPKMELLRRDEYLRVVRACMTLGIRKVRVTGGEPTLYPELDRLLEELGRLGLEDLAMTSNGSLVTTAAARRWCAAGLDRLTLSLDSLRQRCDHARRERRRSGGLRRLRPGAGD
jgi:cyclic pyranopterin phosphate synthase